MNKCADTPRQDPWAAFGGTSRQEKLSKDVIDLTKEVKELKAEVSSEGGSSSRSGPPSSASSSHDQATINDSKRW
eukprot:4421422-Pyramimonas_sp.AAC.1